MNHAEQFATAGRNLHKLAEAMLAGAPEVGFDRMDVVGVFMSATTKILVDTIGPLMAADYLRRVAYGLEVATPVAN